MTTITALSLVFCVGAVPLELSFWGDLDFCDPLPTLEANMATDVVFLVLRPIVPQNLSLHFHVFFLGGVSCR